MSLLVLAGAANQPLAQAIATSLGVSLGSCDIEPFPDGELRVEIHESVRGHDVYLLQPTAPPVERHLLTLLLLADACRRAGASRVTAVVPYFGYARQDRRAVGREPVAARLVADLMQTSGIDRVVAVDLHSAAIEGFFANPVEHLTAVPILIDSLRSMRDEDGVVVAPDLGAAKLADRYAGELGLPSAVVHKTRLSGETVSVRRITGDVRNRTPLIVDDMISTGGTIEAAARAALENGSRPVVDVVATHGLLVGPAVERLRALPIRHMVVTDTLRQDRAMPMPLEVVSVAPLLADAIDRLHRDQSLSELVAHR
jgi:ribose-phosphate pyrophosphokinase